MRTPVAIGLVVLVAIVLCVVALVHLAAARKTAGHRLLWAVVAVALPFVGPLAYLAVGRAMGDEVTAEDDPDLPYRSVL